MIAVRPRRWVARGVFCLLIGATCWSEAELSSAPTATRAENGALMPVQDPPVILER